MTAVRAHPRQPRRTHDDAPDTTARFRRIAALPEGPPARPAPGAGVARPGPYGDPRLISRTCERLGQGVDAA